ncbi:ABC transporter ATP-binding protein [Rhodoligotrophos defluvii]|uniref:ABC transporter ATP-binding protein n=1 Tax=Rhodoligotrophos defluvii TaxID=2561934 RepID=UPI001EF107A2|nr:ABC transporter ATP-binding protein [Rhodoligotrophos defluvii]
MLSKLDFAMRENEVLCLVGHNGAGKSTLLKALFGLVPVRAGRIRMFGEVVDPSPSVMAGAGIAYLPEGRGVFPGLTVSETFTLAAWSAGMTRSKAAARIDDVMEILPPLKNFWTRRAGTLSGGQQQMVSLGRALLSNPKILLLDEPSVGLAPKLFQDLLVPIRVLQRERKLSILLVEQNIREAFGISDRVLVMKSGEIVFTGLPAELDDRSKLLELF